jgi:hypothetical protein
MLLALATKYRVVWKGLPRANTLAYYENSYLTAVKSFITLTLGAGVDKLMFSFPDVTDKYAGAFYSIS